jgi:hypothetical protein
MRGSSCREHAHPMTEADILAAARVAASRAGATLFRNNTGALHDARGRLIRFGLHVGSSDLIGWTPRNGVAVFTAVECKTTRGRLTPEQERFLAAVRAAGGIGLVCRDPDALSEALR